MKVDDLINELLEARRILGNVQVGFRDATIQVGVSDFIRKVKVSGGVNPLIILCQDLNS